MSDPQKTDDLSSALTPSYSNPFEAFQANAQRKLPEYQASQKRIAGYESQIAGDLTNLQNLNKERLNMPVSYKEDYSNVPPVGDIKDYAVTNAPFFLIASALGGALSKKNALAGIQSMNGMMSGALQGSEQAYMRAKQRHDEAIANIQKEAQTWNSVFKSAREFNKDQSDGFRLSIEAANLAIAKQEKIQGNIDNVAKAQAQLYLRSKEVDIATAKLNKPAKDEERTARGDVPAWVVKQKNDVDSGYSATTTYYQAVSALRKSYDALLAKIKSSKNGEQLFADISSASVIGSELLSRINTVASKEYADFQVKAKITAPARLRELQKGMPAGAIRAAGAKLAGMELQTIPDLKLGLNQVSSAMKSFVDSAEAALQYSTEYRKQFYDIVETRNYDQLITTPPPDPMKIQSKIEGGGSNLRDEADAILGGT
jgi:hypothetical protein